MSEAHTLDNANKAQQAETPEQFTGSLDEMNRRADAMKHDALSRGVSIETVCAERVMKWERWAQRHVRQAEAYAQQGDDLLDETHSDLMRMQGRSYAGMAVPHYPHLTDALFGLRGVTLLTSPTGAGKTTLTINMALAIAEQSVTDGGKRVVVYFTMEMPATILLQSLLTIASLRDGDRSPLEMRKMMVGDSGIKEEEAQALQRDNKLRLDGVAREQYEHGRMRVSNVLGKTLHVLDERAVGGMDWGGVDGEHALSALEHAANRATVGAEEVLIIIDSIHTVNVQQAMGQYGGQYHKDDMACDRDITAGLRQWRSRLGDNKALLIIGEESKAATGSGDTHAMRGSSRFAYGADALIALVYADSVKGGGTRHLGKLRAGKTAVEGVTEIDAVINKARLGGKAQTVVMLDHHWQRAQVKEVGVVTASQMRAAERRRRAQGDKGDDGAQDGEQFDAPTFVPTVKGIKA